MAGKILSSREPENSPVEVLQELLFIVQDVLERTDDDIPEELDEVLVELDRNILDLANEYNEILDIKTDMASDIIELSISNASLAMELNKAGDILSELSNTPHNDELIDLTFDLLKLDGRAEYFHSSDINQVKIAFTQEELREALMSAIVYYNLEVGAKALTSY